MTEWIDQRLLRGLLVLLAAVMGCGAPAPPAEIVRVELGRDSAPQPLDPTEIDGLIFEHLGDLAEQGHPLAEVTFTDFTAESLLTIHLDVSAGPPVGVEAINFTGQRTTRPSHLLRCIGFGGRRPFRASEWERARQTLLATGLFARVTGPQLSEARALRTGGADTLWTDVRFELEERRVNRASGLLGYSGKKEGELFGFIDLELGNLFGTGRAAKLMWQAQKDDVTRFEIGWREPFLWRLPLAVDGSLTQVQEDTLYAETAWRGDLLWAATPGWQVKLGWGGSRLVVGSGLGENRSLRSGFFGLRRAQPAADRFGRGWQLAADLESSTDKDLTLRRARLRLGLQHGLRGLLLHTEQDVALITGPDSLLRSDALALGGPSSVRGYFAGAYRAWRQLTWRTELGPRPARGSTTRLYLLLDLGWLCEWRSSADGLYGRRAGSRFLWSAGGGLQAPSRAGDLRLDYAVAAGARLWQGRLHFGLVSRF